MIKCCWIKLYTGLTSEFDNEWLQKKIFIAHVVIFLLLTLAFCVLFARAASQMSNQMVRLIVVLQILRTARL